MPKRDVTGQNVISEHKNLDLKKGLNVRDITDTCHFFHSEMNINQIVSDFEVGLLFS